MRYVIRLNALSLPRKCQKKWGLNTHCSKIWPNLRAKCIWVLKDGDWRSFVQSGIEALIALRDTDKPQDDTAKDLKYKQKERLAEVNEIGIVIPDTYVHYPSANQFKEIKLLANEIGAAREINIQLTNDTSQQLKWFRTWIKYKCHP